MTQEEVDNEFKLRDNLTNVGVGFGFRNFELNADVISNIRYALLPLGINVNEWSMDNDPMNFSHGQVFTDYLNTAPIREVMAEARLELSQDPNRGNKSTCDKLKEKSKSALVDISKYSNVPEGIINCNPVKLNDVSFMNDFMKVGKAQLLEKVMKTFKTYSCVYCHDGDGKNKYSGMNVPDMPMNSEKKFEDYIKTKPALMDSLLDRVTRSPDMPGQMPQYGTRLKVEEIAELKALFQILKSEGTQK